MVMAAQDFVTDMVVDDEALAEWLCRWLWQHRIFLPIWWWMMIFLTDMVVDDEALADGYVDGYGSTGFCYRYGGG